MLEKEDYALLQRALDALRTRNASMDLSTNLMAHIMIPPGTAREKYEAIVEEKKEEHEAEQGQLEEQIILVKAKLIRMKTKTDVDELVHTGRGS